MIYFCQDMLTTALVDSGLGDITAVPHESSITLDVSGITPCKENIPGNSFLFFPFGEILYIIWD